MECKRNEFILATSRLEVWIAVNMSQWMCVRERMWFNGYLFLSEKEREININLHESKRSGGINEERLTSENDVASFDVQQSIE